MARDIKVTLELDNKKFNRSIKQSKAQVDNFSSGASASISRVGAAFAALGAGAVIKSITQTGAAFQDLQNSLNVVFGGIGAGAAAFERVQGFAASTQFSVQTLTQAFVQLKGAGVEPTEELLQTFADTASVTTDQMGTFQAALDLVSRSTAGGLGLEDLNRLADRGIPVFQILQERIGKSRLEISEFGKTAEGANTIIDALLAGLQEDFGGALKSQAGLLNFELNQLGDAFDKLKAALFDTFSEDAAAGVKGLTAAINRLADNTDGLLQLGKGLAQILTVITFFIPAARGLKAAAAAMFTLKRGSSVFAAGAKGVKSFTEGIKTFGKNIKSNLTAPMKDANKAFKRLGKDDKGKDILSDLGRKKLILLKIGEGLLWIGGAIASFVGLKNAIQGVEEISKEANEQFEQMSRYDMGGINEQLFLQREAARMAKEEVERLNAEYNDLTDNDTLFDMDIQKPIDKLKAFGEEIDRSKGGIDEYNRLMKLLNGMFADPQTIADMEERKAALDDLNNSYAELFQDKGPSEAFLAFNEVVSSIAKNTDNYNMLLERLIELQTTAKITSDEYKEAKENLDKAFTENEGLNNFLDTLGKAQVALSEDLATAFLEGEKAGDAFKDFFKKLVTQIIADIIRLQVIQPILGALLSPFGFGFGTGGNIIKIPGKKNGGPVMPGGTYVVGEDGPELLRMGSQGGTVIPNGQSMGGTTIINNISAIDTASFQQRLAADPEFVYNLTRVGARRTPG